MDNIPQAQDKRVLVSIIVAVLNGAKTIQRCIDSIVGQTYPDWELIIQDGGSTDGTVEMIKNNAEKIRYWKSEPDGGVYHAWNKALDHAQGEWISFLGADDYYADPHGLATMMATATTKRCEFVSSRGRIVDAQGNELRRFGVAWNWQQAAKRHGICHPGSLHHRTLFARHGRFNEQYRIAADYDFNMRTGPNMVSAFVDEAIFCIGDGGLCRNKTLTTVLEVIDIQSNIQEIGRVAAIGHGLIMLAENWVFRFLKIFRLENRARKLLIQMGVIMR